MGIVVEIVSMMAYDRGTAPEPGYDSICKVMSSLSHATRSCSILHILAITGICRCFSVEKQQVRSSSCMRVGTDYVT